MDSVIDRPLRIVQISPADVAGGAEKIALGLHRLYRAAGHDSILVVGKKFTDDPDVIEIDRGARTWRRRGLNFARYRMGRQGLSNIESTVQLVELAGNADIIHAHNLHGGYFRLPVLAQLANSLPVVVTLHDHWLLTGHCAHPFDCRRWIDGCGHCPDLAIYPEIRRDGTRFNFKLKMKVLAGAAPTLVAPSRWLIDRLSQSALKNESVRLIPNGIDTNIFCPGDKASARARLDLPQNKTIILFCANLGLKNPYKDPETLLAAFNKLAAHHAEAVLVVLGHNQSNAPDDRSPQLIYRPFARDENQVADYYRAADVLAYATRADNCPLGILEAMACGLPVVAPAIGGIPELIETGETGYLVKPGDADSMLAALKTLTDDDGLKSRFGQNSALKARTSFSLKKMAGLYLECYSQRLGQLGKATAVKELR